MKNSVIKSGEEHQCRLDEGLNLTDETIWELRQENEKSLMIAEFFKILGDPTRINILKCLFLSPLRVCDLASILQMTHSAVSHQMRVLRTAGMVKYRRQGREVIYSLKDNHVEDILNAATIHIEEK